MSCIFDENLIKKQVTFGRTDNNYIIQGDNRNVLDILNNSYNEKIKCIYIDPPYNNGDKYTHFDDSFEHEVWIQSLTYTLSKFKSLLTEDGSIWISIDDNEVHYLKVACDHVFGRKNFITTIVWQKRTTRENRNTFSNNHEYILVYAKNPDVFKKSRNLLPFTNEVLSRYKNPDNDKRGPWQSVTVNVQAGHAVQSQFYAITAPNGKVHYPPQGRCWIYNQERMKKEIADNNIWFGHDGNGVPRMKKFLINASKGLTPETLWLANEVGTNKMAKKHFISLFPNEEIFDTPKPEELLERVIEIATNEGDIVLDAFLGSGTTAATAHKLNRHYIGIEIGEHAFTIAAKRLQKVIEGESGGISKHVKWKGGGGFTFIQVK